MQQTLYRLPIPTRRAPLGVRFERATHVIAVVNEQMNAYLFVQARTKRMHTQGLNRLAMKPGDRARHIVHPMINQRNLRRLAVITKQLQVNIGQTRGGAMPYRASQMGPKLGHALHPDQRQTAQGQQFARLRLAAKKRDVIHHRLFNVVIAGQGGAPRQTHLFDRAPLGRAIFKSFFDHHAGRDRCYF